MAEMKILIMAQIKRSFTLIKLKIFNVIYSILYFLGYDLVPMTLENVWKNLTPKERKQIKNHEFGEPIEIMLEACKNSSNEVTGFQKYSHMGWMRRNLKVVAAVRVAMAENPDIANTPVDEPWVIVGLGRSGTTLLHRLLSCDPRFMSPMLWEMLNPTPPGRLKNWKNTERYKIGKKICDKLTALQTNTFRAMHFMAPDEYEECLFIVGHYFLSTLLSHNPYLKKWKTFQQNCSKEYKRRAYDFYKKALQCIFYGNLEGGKKLLLKAPVHLLYLDTYKEVLPKAKFIFTYRHLPTVMASHASLALEASRMFGNDVDRQSITIQDKEFFKLSCQKAVETFKKMDQDSLVTMGYSELIKDPMAGIRKIYAQFNTKLIPEVEACMQRHLQDNRQHRYGKHTYRPEDYWVPEEILKTEFAEFLDYFKDSPEKLL